VPPRKIELALFASFLVLAILLNSVGAVALHVQQSYGVAASEAGLLAVCKSAGILAASLFAALWINRLGYRRTMLGSLGALAALCAVVPFASSFTLFKLLFAACGVAFAAIKISVYGTVGLITKSPRQHASMLSFLEAFFTFGAVAGSLLFGVFTDALHPESTSWLRVFFVLAALSVVAWALLLGAPLDESRLHAASRRAGRAERPGAFHLTLEGVVLVFGGCVFLYVMLEQSTMNWLPTFNVRVLHFSARHSIQLAALLTLAMTLGRLVGAVVLRRTAWFPVLATCLVVAALLVLLGLVVTRDLDATGAPSGAARLAVFVFPLVGFFVGPIYPAINSAVLASLPVEKHGPLASLGVIFSAGGSSLGTWLVGCLMEAYGGRAALYFALLPILGLLVFLRFLHRRTGAMAPGPVSPSMAGVAE